ncbi:MAG: hypothetical protein JXA20_14385 [Spirochaetes bacterium]|nr:hypothetical protein [Spirochaetota bacterium]
MTSSKAFWFFLQGGSIALFLAAAALGHLFHPEWGPMAWGFLIFLVVLHLGESPVGLKIGRSKGLSAPRSLVKTWLFGFTWWLPLKRGVLEK